MAGPHTAQHSYLGLGGKGERCSPRRAEGEEFSLQNPFSMYSKKLQSSREQGAGYVVQAVVGLLVFGK